MGMVGRLVAAAIVIAAWGGTAVLSHAQEQRPKMLRVEGSTTVYSWVREWLQEFRDKNPALWLIVNPTSTGRGINSLCAREIHVSMASRDQSAEDRQKAEAVGIKLINVPLGSEGVGFVVNVRNPIHDVSIEDLRKIFGGQLTNWKELGGEDVPIQVLIPPPDRATGVLVSKEFLHTSFCEDARIVPHYSTVLKVVARNEAAVSFLREKLALSGRVKALAIRKDQSSAPVQFLPETERNGSYPFVRPLALWYDGNDAANRDQIEQFVVFCVHKFRELAAE
ncbi:MAG: substrate-binding domain-containing protein [Thermodesulfobacteriota bacterium]